MDSKMLQRTGAPQAGLKAVPEGDKLMMLSGDEFVKELFGEKSLDPSPVGGMHSQSPPTTLVDRFGKCSARYCETCFIR